jgi:hypothetical protein
MVQSVPGVLVTSDEATIVYLLFLDERLVGARKFVVRQLDARRIFIKADPAAMRFVQEKLAERLQETTFDEDDEEDGQPYGAQP